MGAGKACLGTLKGTAAAGAALWSAAAGTAGKPTRKTYSFIFLHEGGGRSASHLTAKALRGVAPQIAQKKCHSLDSFTHRQATIHNFLEQ